jgi:hypothetical protein
VGRCALFDKGGMQSARPCLRLRWTCQNDVTLLRCSLMVGETVPLSRCSGIADLDSSSCEPVQVATSSEVWSKQDLPAGNYLPPQVFAAGHLGRRPLP